MTRACDKAAAYLEQLSAARSQNDLAEALAAVTLDLGFSYFALSHHVDMASAGDAAIRLHNYPDEWAEYYDGQGLGISDPVHRASHLTSIGFAWSQMPGLISLTANDRLILETAERKGIGDGFTVPAHVPGESNGSCSFANPKGLALDNDNLPIAQLVGSFAFEAARRLWKAKSSNHLVLALTERQLECVVWMARGKSDWEISRILGIKHETVIRHLKHARERYGVSKRTMLAIHALFDGAISFRDILQR